MYNTSFLYVISMLKVSLCYQDDHVFKQDILLIIPWAIFRSEHRVVTCEDVLPKELTGNVEDTVTVCVAEYSVKEKAC